MTERIIMKRGVLFLFLILGLLDGTPLMAKYDEMARRIRLPENEVDIEEEIYSLLEPIHRGELSEIDQTTALKISSVLGMPYFYDPKLTTALPELKEVLVKAVLELSVSGRFEDTVKKFIENWNNSISLVRRYQLEGDIGEEKVKSVRLRVFLEIACWELRANGDENKQPYNFKVDDDFRRKYRSFGEGEGKSIRSIYEQYNDIWSLKEEAQVLPRDTSQWIEIIRQGMTRWEYMSKKNKIEIIERAMEETYPDLWQQTPPEKRYLIAYSFVERDQIRYQKFKFLGDIGLEGLVEFEGGLSNIRRKYGIIPESTEKWIEIFKLRKMGKDPKSPWYPLVNGPLIHWEEMSDWIKRDLLYRAARQLGKDPLAVTVADLRTKFEFLGGEDLNGLVESSDERSIAKMREKLVTELNRKIDNWIGELDKALINFEPAQRQAFASQVRELIAQMPGKGKDPDWVVPAIISLAKLARTEIEFNTLLDMAMNVGGVLERVSDFSKVSPEVLQKVSPGVLQGAADFSENYDEFIYNLKTSLEAVEKYRKTYLYWREQPQVTQRVFLELASDEEGVPSWDVSIFEGGGRNKTRLNRFEVFNGKSLGGLYSLYDNILLLKLVNGIAAPDLNKLKKDLEGKEDPLGIGYSSEELKELVDKAGDNTILALRTLLATQESIDERLPLKEFAEFIKLVSLDPKQYDWPAVFKTFLCKEAQIYRAASLFGNDTPGKTKVKEEGIGRLKDYHLNVLEEEIVRNFKEVNRKIVQSLLEIPGFIPRMPSLLRRYQEAQGEFLKIIGVLIDFQTNKLKINPMVLKETDSTTFRFWSPDQRGEAILFILTPFQTIEYDEVSAKLERLPQEVRFPNSLNNKIRYDSQNKLLIFKGVMSVSEKDQLLILSKDKKYQEAVERLFQNSQLNLKKEPTPAAIDIIIGNEPNRLRFFLYRKTEGQGVDMRLEGRALYEVLRLGGFLSHDKYAYFILQIDVKDLSNESLFAKVVEIFQASVEVLYNGRF